VVVLEFGYTHCVDVCPVSLASLAQAKPETGRRRQADVQVVFITVDPARDTAGALRSYLALRPGFVGSPAARHRSMQLLKDYGISATKRMVEGSKTDYTMHHSSYLYFIDRQGMQRALMPFGRSPDDIAHDLALLLKR
jgi:protein SCO1/2